MSAEASGRTANRQRLDSQTSNNENNNNSKSSSNKSRSSQKMRKRGRGGVNATNHATIESELISGWLQKFTNYVKGYQRRWFVLSNNGVLSYYLDQSEVNNQQASRGAISVKSGHIEHVDSCTFVISNGSKQNFRIKAESEAERKKWIAALELARGGETVQSAQTPITAVVKQQVGGVRCRRSRVPDKPHYPLNLWSLMKNCIGKDLSKIPMPVNFNEPISMLQRLVEDYEYTEVLDAAAACQDECEQLAYLAAFTISANATAATRINKPFNPLLGETYECDRTDDLGWRCLGEQVSHHPPVAAIHCESREWITWQEFSMTSKFRGKYLQVNPIGGAYVVFPSSGRRYSWRRITTTVNNIIVGKLWVDLDGEMEIIGSNTAQGYKCCLKYIPYSYFGRGEVQRSVKGVVYNRNNEAKWLVQGTWDDKIEIAPVLQTSGTPKNPSYIAGDYTVAWQRRREAPGADKYYNFQPFACQLNEPEEGVAPTDSRLRPDQRYMEDGDFDKSNEEKLRLEEKQRAARRQREAKEKQAAAQGFTYPEYEPKWFKRELSEDTKEYVHVSKGTYWEAKAAQDWRGCPDIY